MNKNKKNSKNRQQYQQQGQQQKQHRQQQGNQQQSKLQKQQQPKQSEQQPQELSYYRLLLLSFLRESHPELVSDTDFIATRADSAAEAYCEAVRTGSTHDAAAEIANQILFSGLHFSKYDVIVTVLWKSRRAMPVPLPCDSFPCVRKSLPNIRFPMNLCSSLPSTISIRKSQVQF